MPMSWTSLDGSGVGGGGVISVEAIEAGIQRTPKIARTRSRVSPKEGKVLVAELAPSGGGIVWLAGVGWAATAEPHLHSSCGEGGRLSSVGPLGSGKGCPNAEGGRGAGVWVP